MDKKICIAIDAMGGENAPYKNIEGISLFCKNNRGFECFSIGFIKLVIFKTYIPSFLSKIDYFFEFF